MRDLLHTALLSHGFQSIITSSLDPIYLYDCNNLDMQDISTFGSSHDRYLKVTPSTHNIIINTPELCTIRLPYKEYNQVFKYCAIAQQKNTCRNQIISNIKKLFEGSRIEARIHLNNFKVFFNHPGGSVHLSYYNNDIQQCQIIPVLASHKAAILDKDKIINKLKQQEDLHKKLQQLILCVN